MVHVVTALVSRWAQAPASSLHGSILGDFKPSIYYVRARGVLLPHTPHAGLAKSSVAVA